MNKVSKMTIMEWLVVVLGILALIWIIPAIVNGQNVVSYKMMKDFDGYKQSTLQLLREKHTDCILAKTIPVIEQSFFGFSKRKASIEAWSWPDKKYERPTFWFNTAKNWTEDEAIVAIVHESLHNTKDRDGNFICGPDRYIRKVGESKIPVCRLFGEEVYISLQLKNAIALHLGKVTVASKE